MLILVLFVDFKAYPTIFNLLLDKINFKIFISYKKVKNENSSSTGTKFKYAWYS